MMIKAAIRPLVRVLPERVQELMRLLAGVASPPADPGDRFQLLAKLAKRLVPHYKLDWPNLDWWQNEGFNQFLARFEEDRSYNASRKFAVSQLVRLVDTIPGDTCECGSYRGASSWLICRQNDHVAKHGGFNRTHHIFDSFAGLSAPVTIDDTNHWRAGALACSEETVRTNLKEFERVQLHAGWIPTKFEAVADRTFSFVHIDVDLYEPTRDSIEFFYPRMSPGGILLCDDYGFDMCPGATRAVEEFLEGKPEKMLSLPTGGGFFVKGCQVYHLPPWG